MIVAGWFTIFASTDGAVRDAQTGASADLTSRAYFVGYAVFTLGNGELVPGRGLWQLATVAMTGSGLLLITLSITYPVPVVSAVGQRRQLPGQMGG